MRRALLKKRYGIPAALLILLALSGVATAFVVENFTYTASPGEPLSFEKKDGLGSTYQGESAQIVVVVTNNSTKQAYGIFVDATVKSGHVDSITYSANLAGALVSTEQNQGNVNGDSDTWDAQYNISAGQSYNIEVTVDTTDDAAPDNLEVTLAFHRRAKY